MRSGTILIDILHDALASLAALRRRAVGLAMCLVIAFAFAGHAHADACGPHSARHVGATVLATAQDDAASDLGAAVESVEHCHLCIVAILAWAGFGPAPATLMPPPALAVAFLAADPRAEGPPPRT